MHYQFNDTRETIENKVAIKRVLNRNRLLHLISKNAISVCATTGWNKDIFFLYYVLCKNQKAIGDMFNVSQASISIRLKLVKHKLRMETLKKLYMTDEGFQNFCDKMVTPLQQVGFTKEQVKASLGFFHKFYKCFRIEDGEFFSLRDSNFISCLKDALNLYLQLYGEDYYSNMFRYTMTDTRLMVEKRNCRWAYVHIKQVVRHFKVF